MTRSIGALSPTTGTITLNLSTLNGTIQRGTLTGNVTLAASNMAAGREVVLILAAGAADRTIAYPAGWVKVGAPVSTIPANKTAIVSLAFSGATESTGVVAVSLEGGVAGPSGPSGPKGDTGSTGAAGSTGPAGSAGIPGADGVGTIVVSSTWVPADGVPAGTPLGTKILRRKS